MEFSISQIAQIIGGKVVGDENQLIHKIDKIETAQPGSITFLSNPAYEQYVYKTKASAIIVKDDFKPKSDLEPTLIMVSDPYTSFTILLEEYDKQINFEKEGIEEPSYVGENSKVGSNVYRGAFSYIGQNVTIGNNVKIHPQAYIGDEVTIGDNTVIHAGVRVYPKCKIGSFCIIHSGAVIGSDGFGFAPQPDGSYKKIPQVGNVVIEDRVEIGANTVIDCATFESTIIRSGAKLDNLIQIAHNVEIGANTVIAAQVGISGSTKIGKNCVLAGQVGIAGHLKIADRVKIGAQAGIFKPVDEEGSVIIGSPAMDRLKFFKSFSLYRKLPELNVRIKQLEEKILNLTAKLGKNEH